MAHALGSARFPAEGHGQAPMWAYPSRRVRWSTNPSTSRLGRWVRRVVVLLSSCVAGAALAAAPPPCSAPSYRDFDFWLGEWEVHTPQNQLAGHNTISVVEGGCLLLEHWQSAAGGSGRSYNFYDPADGLWHQLWVSQGAIIRIAGGPDDDGAMQMEGEIHYQADGRVADFKARWTPRADGNVLQEFWERHPESGEFVVWFKGIYAPKPS